MTRVYDQDGGYREIEDADVERLVSRVDTLIPLLRASLRSFDTDTAAGRWLTVKVALRVVLALALLVRSHIEEGE